MFFTIDITKVTNFYFLAKFFNDDYFQIFEFSSYQTLIKAYINTPYKRNRNFQRFWKKNFSEKKIKANFIVSRTTLCTQNNKFCMQKKISKNVCLRTKFDLRLKKKTKKFLGQIFKITSSKNASRHQKNASHTIPIYGNCMISIFFSKNENLSFLSPDCFIRIKHPQK